MDLEEELGCKLLIRGNRRITLTAEGIFLRSRAQEIVTLFDKTQGEFYSQKLINGEIFIGCGETQAIRLIAKVMKQFESKYPQIHYSLYSGNAQDVMDRLDKGLLDFGILIEPVDVTKYDFIQLPAKDVWGLFMHKNCPLAQKHAIDAHDLNNLPIIVSRQIMKDSTFSKWLGKDASQLHVIATYNLLYNASILADEGLGYVLGLDHIINTTGISSLCFRPLTPPLESGLVIVWKKYQVFSRAAEKFLNALQHQFTI